MRHVCYSFPFSCPASSPGSATRELLQAPSRPAHALSTLCENLFPLAESEFCDSHSHACGGACSIRAQYRAALSYDVTIVRPLLCTCVCICRHGSQPAWPNAIVLILKLSRTPVPPTNFSLTHITVQRQQQFQVHALGLDHPCQIVQNPSQVVPGIEPGRNIAIYSLNAEHPQDQALQSERDTVIDQTCDGTW